MTKPIALLRILLILFSLHGHIATVQNEILCNKVDLIQFIEFPSDQKSCLQVAVEKDDDVSCVLKSLGLKLVFFQITSIQTLRYRNISSETGEKCETFLIFAESLAHVKKIYDHDHAQKQFFPFTKLYLYIFDQLNRTYTSDIGTAIRLRTFLIENALFGYTLEISNGQMLIRDLITNDLRRSIVSYTPMDLFHPMVDTRLAKDNFRISLYNCPPYVFYSENASYERKVKKIDGIEMRFVKEVTKNWKKTYNFRDYSQTKLSPYDVLPGDISNRSTDMAMCSIWVSNKSYKTYDLSKFYGRMCVTFMVPKPIKLNEATAIYSGLSFHVWMSFLCVFLLSSISVNFFSNMEIRLYRKNDQHTDYATTFMETISIVSSHSLHRYSTSDKVSAQMVLTSWILFSVWMDVCYTTIYTSRITSPSYEKPIDTVKQFLDHDMYLCVRYISSDFFDQLRESVSEDDRKIPSRLLVYGDDELYRQRLIAERKCAVFVNPIEHKYIVIRDDYRDLLTTFRLMKSCVAVEYTTFGFQKYSPYTKLFDWHLRRYQEHGIINKWYLDMTRRERRVIFIIDLNPQDKSFHQITLVGVSGSFLLLSSGLVLAVLSFFVEILIGTNKMCHKGN